VFQRPLFHHSVAVALILLICDLTMRLSIIIPAYNETPTIEKLLAAVHAVDLGPIEKEIICVDDFSRDGTAEKLKQLTDKYNLRVFRHEVNKGKGAAIRTGIAAATGDLLIVQDADLEYDPNEYPKLLKPILEDRADVVFGSRFIGGESHRVLYYWHSVGNRALTTLSNMLTNLNLTDMEVGYKLFRAEIIKKITIEEDRFGFEPEITAKVAKQHCRIFEVGISYSGRTYEEGKKIGWQDGVQAIWCILKYNLMR
jgi:glycosyltransferase involved in cell wall biosynthesis